MEQKTVSMRPLQFGDGAFLCSIFKDNAEYYQIFYDSETRESAWTERVSGFIEQKQICHYIIEANDAPIGWLSYIDAQSDVREIGILVIKKEFSGCGYGGASLSWLIEKSKKDRISTLLLSVNQDNVRAIKLYRKFGFEIVAEEIVPECNDAIDLAQYKMKRTLL